MIELFNKYVSYFTSTAQEIEYIENFQEVFVTFETNNLNQSLPSNIDIADVNVRDVLEITVYYSAEEDADTEVKYLSSEENAWNIFIASYEAIDKDERRKIKIRISKDSNSSRFSVYDFNKFLNYLNGLSFELLLNQFDRLANIGCRVIEIQSEFDRVVAGRFAFVPKDFIPNLNTDNSNRANIIRKANQLCCNDLIKESLLPSDFHVEQNSGNHELIVLLNKVQLLYTACFLFDYIRYANGVYDYKINGFKTLSEVIDVSNLGRLDTDPSSAEQFLEAYKWVYTGGNPLDKIVIARNIISLNLIDLTSLSISNKTIDAIISNYRIYEKENVKQYISVRNDISKQLRDYQREIIKVVDEFDGDFKKSFFTSLTFVFTTVLIRVLAKNITDAVIVPDIILFLLIGYCILSLCYYFYARWVLDSKIKLFDAQYKKSRKYYEEILSEKELSDLFDDIRTGDGSYEMFQKERKTKYRNLWLWGTVSLIVVFMIMLISNHWDVLTEIKEKLDDLYRIYKDCTQCCSHCGK